jgi:hypothetical protein
MTGALTIDEFSLHDGQCTMVSESQSPAILTDIYNTTNNLVIWKRTTSETLLANIEACLKQNPRLSITREIDVNSISTDINKALEPFEFDTALADNVSELVDMFCCLFDLTRAGLRLKVLEHAMCPRFHVDKVPCRLITTLYGQSGTQWLPHHLADREKLGAGNHGLPVAQSGLYPDQDCIQSLDTFDVALFKVEAWIGNENAGVVHRSPPYVVGEQRLLMTLDFLP